MKKNEVPKSETKSPETKKKLKREKSSKPKKEKNEEKPDLLGWYFSKKPRVLITAPIFIALAINTIGYIFYGVSDLITFFQGKGLAGVAIALVLGTFLLMALGAPVYLTVISIGWLYDINVSEYGSWKKFLYSVGIVLFAVVGIPLVRMAILALFGIESKF